MASLGLYARAPRQTGLKKPRPLRTTSADNNDVPDRQIYVTIPADEVVSPTTKSPITPDFPVSEGIVAMSAMIAAQAEQETSGQEERQRRSPSVPHVHSPSSNSQVCPLMSPTTRKVTVIPNTSNTNFKSNKDYGRPAKLPLHGEPGTGMDGPSSRSKADRPGFSRSISENYLAQGENLKHKERAQKTPEKQSSPSSSNGTTCIATLLTNKGDELSLSGRNIQAILGAARILVCEMGANIIHMEHLSDSDKELDSNNSNANSSKFNRSLSTPVTTNSKITPPTTTNSEPASPQSSNIVHKYSKRELLTLSQSVFSKQPPAMWNILSETHSECCIPVSEASKYFLLSEFHTHDGSLVVSHQGHGTFRKERCD